MGSRIRGEELKSMSRDYVFKEVCCKKEWRIGVRFGGHSMVKRDFYYMRDITSMYMDGNDQIKREN